MDREAISLSLGMSEAELDELGDAYESDEWDASQLGKVVMGRPRLPDEETRAVTVRLPISQIAALDRVAKLGGKTRSAAMRDVLGAWLKNVAAL